MKFSLCKAFLACATAAALAGCASSPFSTEMGSPLSSKEKVNGQLFLDKQKGEQCIEDVSACVSTQRIPVGTDKAKVFEILGMDMKSLTSMNKQSTKIELYGQDQMQIPFEKKDQAQEFLNTLEGMTATYRSVQAKKSFGLTSARVNTKGISVTFNFVFKDGKLYNPISATKTPINQANSKGYFEDMGIGGILNAFKL